jgi:preprotein translocase subunit YajC
MFFDSIAHAMGAAPGGDGGQGNPIAAFLPLIIMFAIFYFLLIRPQQKKAKQHKKMLADLTRGDYVLTGGGLYGRIQEVDGDVLTVELAENLKVKVNRSFISSLSTKSGETAENPK